MLMGNLNVNLRHPATPRDDAIGDVVDEADLSNLILHYQQHKGTLGKRWLWRQRRFGRWVSSHPDYLLLQNGDRRLFRKVGLRAPPGKSSVHQAVMGWG